jgi:hypothetical protein
MKIKHRVQSMPFEVLILNSLLAVGKHIKLLLSPADL